MLDGDEAPHADSAEAMRDLATSDVRPPPSAETALVLEHLLQEIRARAAGQELTHEFSCISSIQYTKKEDGTLVLGWKPAKLSVCAHLSLYAEQGPTRPSTPLKLALAILRAPPYNYTISVDGSGVWISWAPAPIPPGPGFITRWWRRMCGYSAVQDAHTD